MAIILEQPRPRSKQQQNQQQHKSKNTTRSVGDRNYNRSPKQQARNQIHNDQNRVSLEWEIIQKLPLSIRIMILLYSVLITYYICFSSYSIVDMTKRELLHIRSQQHIRNTISSNHTSPISVLRSNHIIIKNEALATKSNHQTFKFNKTTTNALRQSNNKINAGAATRTKTVKVPLNDTVLVVIISDRLDGIIPTVASILTHTKSKPVDIVLIGNNQIVNQQVKQHFMNNTKTKKTASKRTNIHQFTSYSVTEIQDDLMQQGYKPIWTWSEWGSSRKPNWFHPEYTLHVAKWDSLETHAHELNHLRFYLPHVSHFRHHKYLYFIDDDILVQKDLGYIADTTMQLLDPDKGIVTPCNIWIWNDKCHSFAFHNEDTIQSILQMPSLYGDRKVCQTDTEIHCYPSTYKPFLDSMLQKVTNYTLATTNSSTTKQSNPRDQKAWNFGFSLFALDHWRRMDLTSRYEIVMKESYRLHVFPETSLTFGLGVSYIAFAGAVECWNDNIMKVRDGFGFIEYNRFAQTFGGSDFIQTKVDVIHYTGPTKPWVANSTIESRSIQPWLDYMQAEGMTIPVQLPEENGKQLFTLLASERAGAQWIMSLLDDHPSVCASGEEQKPESGFPTDVVQPWGTPWLPTCSVKRGCSFAFILNAIQELARSMDRRGRTNRLPARCRSDHKIDNDELGHHLPRVCKFFLSLKGNYTDSAIAVRWVDAFREENQDLLPCSCPRGTVVKGFKVLTEWILYQNFPNQPMGPPDMNLNDTAINGSKIIRLKRRNLWEQYLSSVLAEKSGMYHIKSPGEKELQLSTAGNITISISDMLTKIHDLEEIDKAGDEWARNHAESVLEVYHEDCSQNTPLCFKRIFDFLGVDASFPRAKKTLYDSIFRQSPNNLPIISNIGAVKEALAVNGYGKYIGLQNYSLLQLLIYDDSETVDKTHQFHEEKGINAIMFGRKHGSHNKYYSKFAAAMPELKKMASDSIVILSDNRDVRVHFPAGSDFSRYEAINNFRSTINNLTKAFPGAIIGSAESYCCASALTHAKLGGYFNVDGTRKSRSCVSGQPGCDWAGLEKAQPWQSFMQDLAVQRGYGDSAAIYLDGTLLGGKASDLIALIDAARIGEAEDELAVLTDFMFHNPNKLVVDYDHKLFGKNRDGLHDLTNSGCPFKTRSTAVSRSLGKSNEDPLFMHAPRALGCAEGRKGTTNPIFPRWADTGIQIDPILDHIDRVANEVATITAQYSEGKPIYYQGPELLYFPDERGVWTSKMLRDRTDNLTLVWRMEPTENLIHKAHQILKSDHDSQRWNLARKSLRNGGFPYWSWYGDYKSCNFHNFQNYSIPLFTTSVVANCDHAFPVPNYMNIIDSQPSADNWRGLFRDTRAAIPWESKIRKVVWRGSLSEADGNLALSSIRWRVSKMVSRLNSSMYDVGLTSIPPWVSNQVSINVSEIGGLMQGISPMSEFQRYRAIMDMDGNSWSSRFATLLCYNSVIIKIEPKHVEYFYSTLQPWTHYIPVKDDLSDLHENVAWALNPDNESTVQDIVEAANEWCIRRMVPDELAHDLLDIWEAYVRNLNRADPHWQKKWLATKSSILSATSNLDFIRLRDRPHQ